jgi:hypothetical protein
MSERRIRVNTSSSSSPHGYKVSSYDDTYWIYHLSSVGIFSDDWDQIGKTRSLEDALVIIRAHASKFGIVRDIEFRD